MHTIFKGFFKLIVFQLLIVLLVDSCMVGPEYSRPEVNTPESYRSDFPSDTTIASLPWWEMFGDTVLQNMILTSLDNNRDLKAATARIKEAEAAMGVVRADLYPRIDYAADGSLSATTDGSSASLSPMLSVSYEVDLWGRIRRLNEAALQEFLATEEAYRAITITLVSAVANGYLLLRDIDNRLLISESMAKTWQSNLEIVEAKHRAGIVSGVNVNQAEIQLSEALVAIQINERLRSQTENSLSILMGLPPQNIPRGMTLQDQVFPPELPSGLPSQLLSRRPDIRQAERRLNAQSERIGAAEALKYPQLVLSANTGAQFANPTVGFASLGAQLFGPLLNAKASRRRVEIEMARTEQLLNAYEQTYLVALREVEDAMVAVQKYKLEFDIRISQMEAANNAVKLSWIRYDSGLTNYLEILDLQRSQFNSQLKASQALQLQLTSTVNLYKALGGGWLPELEEEEVE